MIKMETRRSRGKRNRFTIFFLESEADCLYSCITKGDKEKREVSEADKKAEQQSRRTTAIITSMITILPHKYVVISDIFS